MKIVWSKTADKPFSKIDNRYKSRIKSRLEKMDDKASSISDIKKLSSPENHYRLRLGDYRVIYTFGDPPGDTCYVVAVKRRTTTTYLHEEDTEYDYSVHQE
ncbi:type II toxin-antitoxin system RelE/ParE family toxin [Klebsiella variicola]|nr:type II toxin-antitoxin system RelE/ParE family toxin [Klebsiella variicola]